MLSQLRTRVPACLLLGCLFIGCAGRSESAEFSKAAVARQGQAKKAPGRSLGDMLKQPADSAARMIPNMPRQKVDQAAATAAGIRKLKG
jgi:hypothetical protein